MDHQNIVSYIFCPDGIVLLPYSRIGVGNPWVLPRKAVQRGNAVSLQMSSRIQLTWIWQYYTTDIFPMNMEGNEYWCMLWSLWRLIDQDLCGSAVCCSTPRSVWGGRLWSSALFATAMGGSPFMYVFSLRF